MRRPHLLPYGRAEVRSQKTYAGAPGTVFVFTTSTFRFFYLPLETNRLCTRVFSGFLLPVALRGATRRVSGEYVQPGQSSAPDGSHTFGHTLLPEGAYVACTEAGGKATLREGEWMLVHGELSGTSQPRSLTKTFLL